MSAFPAPESNQSMMHSRSPATDQGGKGLSIEMAPIMISRSEDDISIDASDLEVERITSKYIRKNRTSSKVVRMATLAVIICMTTFAVYNSSLHQKEKDPANVAGSRSKNRSSTKAPKHKAFGLMRSKYLSTHQATMHVYKHRKTQAEFMAYIPVDEAQDKVFGISFRTKPTSDNGVAHILEHSVLSGSRKYQAKDPFLTLAKGSLNTFLNAMTYNDRTVYPVASRNKKDFFNLMSVYLDAVFAPRCVTDEGDWVLKQEGWRYDFDDKNNMEIKGVVYNEMKGVFSDPLSVLDRQSNKALFPDNSYHFESGGDPDAIPSLTQEEFVDFYKRHYHPTNSQSFVSGTADDIIEALDLIDSYMNMYTYNAAAKTGSEIKYQKKNFKEPLPASIPYAVRKIEENQGQDMFAITWLLNDSYLTLKALLGLYVLDYLLIGTNSAPLQKSLAESDLGTSVIGDGFSTGLLQSTFTIGLQGVKNGDVLTLEKKIMDTLMNIKQNGFVDDEIEAAMNSIEFQLREVHAGSDPMGIGIFLNALTTWNYDKRPEESIAYENALNDLKEVVNKQGSKFFERMIRTYLLENNHRVHMHLYPSATLESEMTQNEQSKVKAAQNSLTEDELKHIQAQVERLNTVQNTDDPQEVIDQIPSLTLADIDRSGVEYEISRVDNAFGSAATLTTNVIDGNSGIVYIDIGVDIASLAYENVEHLPFYISMLRENDTKDKTRAVLDREIGMHTGGIGLDLTLLPLSDNSNDDYIATQNNKMRSLLFFRAKCTTAKIGETLELIRDLATKSVPVSREKAIQILERKIANYESSIPSSGHAYAIRRIHARYNNLAFLSEKLYGVHQLKILRKMLHDANHDWKAFERTMIGLTEFFSHMRARDTVINLTGDLETLESVKDSIESFVISLENVALNSIPQNFFEVDHPWMIHATEERWDVSVIRDESIAISSQVSYIGTGGMLFNEGEKVNGQSCAPLQFLKKGYLWDTVRAKNGAYGVMAVSDRGDGFLGMVSYRDPQLQKTVEVFHSTAQFLNDEIGKNAITKDTIKTAIVGCIGSIDGSALPPIDAGWTSFIRHMSGSTATRRQKWRDEILSTGLADFVAFGVKLEVWTREFSIVALAPKALIDEAEGIAHKVRTNPIKIDK
jgi:Zn-dependent M16 (insulinase) family peptidase